MATVVISRMDVLKAANERQKQIIANLKAQIVKLKSERRSARNKLTRARNRLGA